MDDAQSDARATFIPYGEWPSPVPADALASHTKPLEAVAIDGGRVLWLERRAQEGGRSVLVAHDGTARYDVVGEGASVRTTAHEYGGGAFTVRNGVTWYCDFSDQRIYRSDGSGDATPITPEPSAHWSERYADLWISPGETRLLAVRERHGETGVIRDIVALSPTGDGEILSLAGGHDFFASPRLSPDGRRLAWVSWDHPRMPWDGTQLWVADIGPRGDVGRSRLVAGVDKQSVQQPAWGPDGSLWFVNDPDGWWNLYRLPPGGDVEQITGEQAEYGWPAWQFGLRTFGFLDDGRVVAVVNDAGVQHIATIEPGKGATRAKLGFTAVKPHLATDGRNVVFVAGTPSQSMAVVRWDPVTDEVSQVQRECTFELHPDDVSVARAIEFPTEGGDTAHAFFYAPRNRSVGLVAAGDEVVAERPPLVVMSHGGPTGQSPASFSLGVQYWTTRGIAVVDVNYRGSTGYGRAYRERLNGRWGIVDVEDCINAARFLADAGLIDRNRMAIRGGSAGGFTTLCALTFHDDFAAGASYFGVADIELLAEHTHDFESRYMDTLVGPLPEAKELCAARSPIYHTHRLTTPIILFQGLEDTVVPPAQAERMVAALAERGVPHAYVTFEGEQHGFRRAASIVRAQEAELAFYGQIMGFDPVDVPSIELRTGEQNGKDPGS